jgi:hypothetical protein
MNRKTIALCLALAAAPVFAVAGDTDTPPRDRRGPSTAMLTEVLQLRADQVAPVEAILAEQRQAHRDGMRRDRDERQALREETLGKLAGVLDAEQLARFDGFTQGMRMGGKGMRRRCDGANRPAAAR